ncbi:LysR substrate-binding domain-containing protein [Desulfovibrio sp. UCD-KL4C]|uniref:LysR substrate-binding domain-containing protein n=1 Tax=Desulfovibrio sp. UCD-KL4C TaxID=2578120 RepID=UPI0025BEDAA7|nr:LysR substrate-binding domain-containing protein [Desulfovibrio sp. UCD-KL4C]
MNLQIDYLKTFIAVADTQSFTKAGKLVNRSQSAVSMQIKRLEEEIGRPLFERIGKTAKLSIDGKLLISHARGIIQSHDKAVMSLSTAKLKGIIRFGSPEHYTTGILPKLLAGFASAYPEVLIEMHCENSDIIKKRLDAGDLDLGLCTDLYDHGQIIYHDHLVWAANPDFKIRKNTVLPLAVEDECIFQEWALNALDKAGISYRVVYVSRGLSGILDAVRAGLAIAPAIKRNLPTDLAILGTKQGLPLLPKSSIVLNTRNPPLPEHVNCFAEHLITAFKEEKG